MKPGGLITSFMQKPGEAKKRPEAASHNPFGFCAGSDGEDIPRKIKAKELSHEPKFGLAQAKENQPAKKAEKSLADKRKSGINVSSLIQIIKSVLSSECTVKLTPLLITVKTTDNIKNEVDKIVKLVFPKPNTFNHEQYKELINVDDRLPQKLLIICSIVRLTSKSH